MQVMATVYRCLLLEILRTVFGVKMNFFSNQLIPPLSLWALKGYLLGRTPLCLGVSHSSL